MTRPHSVFDVDVSKVQREAEQLRSETLRNFFGEIRKRFSSHNG